MNQRILYLDEDQLPSLVEFLPIENYELLRKYPENFEGGRRLIDLEIRKLSYTKINNAFKNILIPYQQVRYESIPDENLKHHFAYGNDICFISGMIEDQHNHKIVTELSLFKGYFNINNCKFTENQVTNLAHAIFKLCQEEKLILFDWETRKVIKLTTSKAVENYLNKNQS